MNRKPATSSAGPEASVVNAGVMDLPGDESDGATYRATRYTVYPTGFSRVATDERRHWCLFVEDAGDGWAVRWRSRCLNYRSVWEFEPSPKSRTADFLRRCRFSERAALARAKQAVDELVVNGMTYDEFVDHVREEAAAKARTALEVGASATPAEPDPSRPVLPLANRLRRALSHGNPDPSA